MFFGSSTVFPELDQANKEAKAAAGIPAQTPGTPGSGAPELPAALAGSMKKDKKPFTYLPGGLDLSEIRSPKMQRRIMANQQYAPPPPSAINQLQPRTNEVNPQAQTLPNQFERLNLGEQQQSVDRMATAVEPQRRASTDGQDRYPGQSRSFRILQMMTGGDDETDSAPPPQPPAPGKKEEEEMRFTGLRRPDNPIPSRAFQALQKMTSGNEEVNNRPGTDPHYRDEGQSDQQNEDTPVDIRYKGAYIPGRSFKMLQEMTGMNEDGTPIGPPVPSVLQEKRNQRKPPSHLHLNINNQPPPQKQFPQPQVPASMQQTEEAPKMYSGSRIPSQSFRILQAMTGANGGQGEDGTDM
ncbi:uncharacterized protein TNCT_665261 [Trichonephila clavata]|uniref:Uncharacterized protein n=1 Tax=Trichonephila clavata TaxID=2740835 RepID=A0A8X6F4V8_TRICU|nr:uncharacterized protein TNCT_665261 [Trichonephila clavata]